MSGLYSNKFVIETNDVARIIFVDERAPVSKGMPMSSQTVAEIVMTHANFIALAKRMAEVANRLRGGEEIS